MTFDKNCKIFVSYCNEMRSIEITIQELTIKSKTDLDDKIKFNAAAMSIFQAINRSIDLADEIIVECKLTTPFGYKETFEILLKEKIIDETLSKKMTDLVYYRNLISHEYYQITKKDIEKLKSMSKYIRDFVRVMKEFVQKHSL